MGPAKDSSPHHGGGSASDSRSMGIDANKSADDTVAAARVFGGATR